MSMLWEDPKEKNHSFVAFPRWIADLYREKKISQSEFLVYVWIRLDSDVYGKTRTSFADLTYDLFRGKIKSNTVDKVVLALRKKKLIYYEKMQGKKGGTFIIYNDEILLKGGQRTSIDHRFSGEENTVFSQKSSMQIQKSSKPHCFMNKTNIQDNERDQFRSVHNENEIEKKNEIKIDDSIFQSLTSDENSLCLKIGDDLGEKNLNFLKMLLGQHGFQILNNAYEQYIKDKDSGKIIGEPREHFRNLVVNLKSHKITTNEDTKQHKADDTHEVF